ncbi:MAG: diguanylate cyclase [Desulfobacteraceae bacterium]
MTGERGHPDYTQEVMLVVDDNALVRDTLVRLVSALGFSVESASSGFEALDLLNRSDFSFMLTDMKMPGMDGLELIKEARERHPELSIISMTGYAEGYRYVDVINAGASDFIKKPFDIEELEAKVRRIINERSLKEELSRLSVTDSLTGLYNHRQFFLKLRKEVLRSRRQKQDLAVVLIDLDDFKAFNDACGHLAGDAALRTVGRIIQSSIREGVDSGYRYGGDEFAVILIDAGIEVAREIVERIRKGLEAHGGLGASFGISRFEGDMSANEMVDEADRALYRMKEQKKRDSA